MLAPVYDFVIQRGDDTILTLYHEGDVSAATFNFYIKNGGTGSVTNLVNPANITVTYNSANNRTEIFINLTNTFTSTLAETNKYIFKKTIAGFKQSLLKGLIKTVADI